MMDRNREARRAAAMTNGLPRRRHRTTTGGGGSLRESPGADLRTVLIIALCVFMFFLGILILT